MIPKQLKSYKHVSKSSSGARKGCHGNFPLVLPEYTIHVVLRRDPRTHLAQSRLQRREGVLPSARPPGEGPARRSRGRRAAAILPGGGGEEPPGTAPNRPPLVSRGS